MPVHTETLDDVVVVTIDRPEARNAVDRETADALEAAFLAFDADTATSVAILTGAGGTFCAGADLKAAATGDPDKANRIEPDRGPMGPTRLALSKPVIAAVEGYAVAGGVELALWCDLRVASETAVFGVFCRRWGVPLMDGGNVRLPRLIGLSHALDLVLTGRPVQADEALRIGLANRIVPEGEALTAAVALARGIATFPQVCVRGDRRALLEGLDIPIADALSLEHDIGLVSLGDPALLEGATRFVEGAGRHGSF